jgi:Leucine-rich repeat (LRR) protein
MLNSLNRLTSLLLLSGSFLLATGVLHAQTVTFDDPNLENAVRVALGIGPTDPLTLAAVQTLTSLFAIGNNIQSLGGIESLPNLNDLGLDSNSISDITPLAGLTQLEFLSLGNNPISDITALVSNPGLGAGDSIGLNGTALGFDDCPDLQALIGRGVAVFDDVKCETFNPTAKVTLGGSQPGSVIAAGTTPQIVRTTTFFFNLEDDLPSSRTMSFDTGVLNINTIALGTRLFETNIVISTAIFGAVATARVGHTVVSLNQDSATLVGTVEAATIDPGVSSFLGSEVIEVMQALIGSVGMNSSISANSGGFSYTDSFNVPNDTVSEDVQSFQIQAVVTDTFPANLYTIPQLAGTLTVSNQLTSLIGLTSGLIIDQFTVSGSAPSEFETILIANFTNGNNAFLNSRVYLWNPSESDGSISARAYTLPRSGPSILLGMVELGLLNARSARNIKIDEDILAPLGLPLPYTADGGNVTVEFTVGAENVGGAAQVFSDSLAFGTYPMQVIP